MDVTDRDAAWYALHDPATTAERLAQIAATHPDFAAQIAAHPQAYPELRHWAAMIGSPVARPLPVAQALPAQPSAVSASVVATPGVSIPSASAYASADSSSYSYSAAESGGSEPTPTRPPLWRRMSRRAAVASAIGTVVIAGGAIWGISAAVASSAAQQAREDFGVSVDWLERSASTLGALTVEATSLIEATPMDAAADPATVSTLQRLVGDAQAIDVASPPMADTTAEIQALSDEIDRKAATIDELGYDMQTAMDDVRASVQALVLQKLAPNATHEIVAVDQNGNQRRITVRIGSWVRGTDPALLDQAWASVGGEGVMPLADGSNGFTIEDGAFVFGTVRVENLTTDFPAANFGNGSSLVYLHPMVESDGWWARWSFPEAEGMGVARVARVYSSGTTSEVLSSSAELVNPAMESDAWGPASFVIGLDRVFTPNHPDGNPMLDQIVFFLNAGIATDATGDTRFQIGRSW